MDLWRRELPNHANALWNRYLTAADEFDGLPLMPLFLSCRAAIRAKTSATAARATAALFVPAIIPPSTVLPESLETYDVTQPSGRRPSQPHPKLITRQTPIST